MKAFKYYLLLSGILFSTVAFSQITKLKNLNDFNKIILKGDVSEIDVSRSHDGEVSILVEGVKDEDVITSLQAGTLILTISNANNALVHVFNNDLNRIEGKDELIISGADYIGSRGKFLIRGFNHDLHNSYSFNGNHGFHFNLGHDIDIDLDLDDLDLDVQVDVKDHDWNWNWQWDWNWEDHRDQFRSHTKDLKHELKEIKEDLKDDLKDLKKDLKEDK